jgi:hypothetical protein
MVLTAEADERQRKDPAYQTELATWARTRARERDGVPVANRPGPSGSADTEVSVPHRLTVGAPTDSAVAGTGTPPAIFVIATSSDDALSRVRAGEALSALWLAATDRGFAGVPLSQATEVDETRELLRSRELGDRACPQVLFCVGWPAPDREPLPPTPRRQVADVLVRT